MIHFRATGRAAYARTDEPLTTGSVGIPVDVSLSSDFDGLQSVVVFRSGDVTADMALLGQDVVVPPQVLTGRVLSMGVYASSTDGNTVIPTVWCDVGLIRGSTATEFDPAEPTPGWSAQIQSWAEDAADSATQAASVVDSIRADMDEFNESSAIVLKNAQAATTAANGAATNANAAASAANASASAADAATASAIEATGAANDAASAASDATALATSAAGVATTAAGNADTATAAARAATADAQTATTNANAATSAASAATTDAQNATAAASQATADATTATAGANTAAAAANMAADGANDAAGAANAATSAANSAANQATAAANNANSKANLANTAANNANTATLAANDATARANSAIDAMGDISEQAVPVMSADVRGGAKIQHDSGLEITDTDNLQVRLALESEGDVRGGILGLTAKGHAEQDTTTGKNLTDVNTFKNGSVVDTRAVFQAVVNAYDGSTYVKNLSLMSIGVGGHYSLTFDVDNASYTYRLLHNGTKLNINIIYDIFAVEASVGTYVLSFDAISADPTVANGLILENIQLELGSTATEYEPYTGGAPSPSPDYPQEIQVVRGRNLLPPNFENGNIDSNGQNSGTSSSYVRTVGMIKVEPNTRYSATIQHLMEHTILQVYVLEYTSSGAYVAGSRRALYSQNVATTDIISPTFTTSSTTGGIRLFIYSNDAIGASVFDGFQLERGSTPQPYVPYGHVGMEVQGRNLFDKSMALEDKYIDNASGAIFSNNVTNTYASDFIRVVAGETYSITNTGIRMWGAWYDASKQYISGISNYAIPQTAPTNAAYIRLTVLKGFIETFQVEANNHVTDYEPYYYTTTPIPLPSRGWVAGLPDGTADVLTLDGAGKVVWELATQKADTSTNWVLGTTSPNSHGIGYMGYTINTKVSSPFDAKSRMMSSIGLQTTYFADTETDGFSANSETVFFRFRASGSSTSLSEGLQRMETLGAYALFPPKNTVTEDCGYCEDWPTDIPEGAVVTIRELDSVGIKYFIDSAVTELARQWYARANSEYADRLTALEQAVAELATS